MSLSSVASGRLTAVLGPTNTGKTYLAIERMLGHQSGMIGFPLRLLARENYDRIAKLRGVGQVALITGEEKIVPPTARYFVCTVESMPLDRPVSFLAVDEVQMAADPERGHFFTDRILHARGMDETMLLGADTIRPVLNRLLPDLDVIARPRFSKLSYVGPKKATRLPARSAVVGFSANEVYAIAELIRRQRGGTAIVMGALSPRTRNAQVEMFQSGEVEYLVATDAIGMGLNMDVNHVAFAGLGKFDGHRPRPLSAAEIAQIAGRAGRGMRDGTFGTTATCPPLAEELAEAVEAHVFEPLAQLVWRNAELDFGSIDALLASLTAPPPRPGLVRGNDAADLETLAALAGDAEIRALARGAPRVRALWDACQVPDFRKITDDSHVRLCARIFAHSARGETLPDAWLETQFAQLASTDGDIDTLMARLTGVRVWSYIAARPDWVVNSALWQARARTLEDRLSDVLHERLTARFVDRRAAHLLRRLQAAEEGDDLLSAVTGQGEVVVEGHAVGRLAGFGFLPDPDAAGAEKRLVQRAARRALYQEMPRRVAALDAAPDAAITLTPDLALAWQGAKVARLRAGATAIRPVADIIESEFLDGPQRERVRLRLQAWLDARGAAALAPLHAALARAAREPVLRGPLHLLAEAAGMAPGAGAAVAPADRARLRAIGVRAGRFALYIPDLLRPQAAAWRAVLWAVWHRTRAPALPDPGRVSVPVNTPEDAGLRALGWIEAGPVLLRLDIAERLAAELAWLTRARPAAAPPQLASRLGISPAQLPPVLRALGVRLLPVRALRADEYGPPPPLMLAAEKRRFARPKPPPPAPLRPDSPFAVLAGLRR